jgi:hypothetical protein
MYEKLGAIHPRLANILRIDLALFRVNWLP